MEPGRDAGVDSGLPDFRGNQGFWKAYPPYARLGLGFTALATPASFRSDPPFGWGFYGHRLNLYRAAVPHGGFRHPPQVGRADARRAVRLHVERGTPAFPKRPGSSRTG